MRKSDTGKKLKAVMAERNLRQIDVINLCKPLCEKYGISPITSGLLSQYISGKCEPMEARLTILAQALGVSEAWLMGFDVPMDRYAYVDPEDAEFLAALPPLYPVQELSPELEALNTLLAPSGRHIMKTNDKYYLDEAGQLTDDEVNELLTAMVLAGKNAADLLTAKKRNELMNFFDKKQ